MRLFFNQVDTSGGGSSGAPAPGGSSVGSGTGAPGAQAASAGVPDAAASGKITTNNSSADWTSSFSPETKGYAEKKGFKDPSQVVESYMNLEKLVGVPQDQIVKLDKEMDDAKWGEVFQKLGKPKEAKEYKIEVPEVGGSTEMAEWAKNAFHKANLTQTQADAFTKQWNEYAKTTQENSLKQMQIKGEEQQQMLKKEWGAAFDQNMKQAKAAATTFGVKPEVIDAMEKQIGSVETMKFFASIGSKIGEDSFVSSGTRNNSFGVMTPDAAKNEIQTLQRDQTFVNKYVSGDAEAKARMQKLHQWAYPEN